MQPNYAAYCSPERLLPQVKPWWFRDICFLEFGVASDLFVLSCSCTQGDGKIVGQPSQAAAEKGNIPRSTGRILEKREL